MKYPLLLLSTAILLCTKARAEDRQKPEGQVGKISKILKSDPKNINTHIELAKELTLAGQRKEALLQLGKALEIAKPQEREKLKRQRRLISEAFYTNSTFQQYQNGLDFIKSKNPEKAAKELVAALTKEPFNVSILSAYSRALEDLGKMKKNIKTLEQAFLLNPDNKMIRFNLGKLLIKKNPRRTLTLLQPLIKEKDSGDASIIYARALMQMEKPQKAVVVLEKSLKQNNHKEETLYWLGKIYAQIPGKNEKARAYLTLFLQQKKPKEGQAREEDARAILEKIHHQ